MAEDKAAQDDKADDKGADEKSADKSQDKGDKSGLVDEKIKLRKRAQDAEARVKELETAGTDLKSQLDVALGEKDTLTEKVKTFEFRDLRTGAINKAVTALPEGHVVSDPVKLLKYAEKLGDPATLEKDIADLVADFAGPAAVPGTQQSAWPGVAIVALGGAKPNDSQSGSAGQNGVPKFDPTDIYGMAQFKKSNPSAYDAALKAWQAKK